MLLGQTTGRDRPCRETASTRPRAPIKGGPEWTRQKRSWSIWRGSRGADAHGGGTFQPGDSGTAVHGSEDGREPRASSPNSVFAPATLTTGGCWLFEFLRAGIGCSDRDQEGNSDLLGTRKLRAELAECCDCTPTRAAWDCFQTLSPLSYCTLRKCHLRRENSSLSDVRSLS